MFPLTSKNKCVLRNRESYPVISYDGDKFIISDSKTNKQLYKYHKGHNYLDVDYFMNGDDWYTIKQNDRSLEIIIESSILSLSLYGKRGTRTDILGETDLGTLNLEFDKGKLGYFDRDTGNFVTYGTTKQKSKPKLPKLPIISERRLVVFINSLDIDELNFYVGYITDNSRYIAPYMYDTGLGYWINYGKIYGYVEIDSIFNRFYLSYTRDYSTDKIMGEVIRSAFIPGRETAEDKEYPVTIDDEKRFLSYYNGIKVSKSEYDDYIHGMIELLEEYLPKLLTGVVMSY